jgi:hypothetical protein
MCVLEIREIVRRLRLGETERRIGRDLGVGRNTVARYRAWAEERGFLAAGDLPSAAELESARATAPAAETPLVAPPSKAAARLPTDPDSSGRGSEGTLGPRAMRLLRAKEIPPSGSRRTGG